MECMGIESIDSSLPGFPTLKLFSSPTAAGEEFQGARQETEQ